MMILRTSAPSPYGRKIKIAASLLNIDKDIKVETADTNDPADTVRIQNPLGKIPTLVLADGLTLFDSRVIMEYLDHLAGGGRIIPTEPGAASARCACKRSATAFSMPRCCWSTRPASARRTGASANGPIIKARRSNAASMCWKKIRRRSTPCRMWADRARLRARLSGSALPGPVAEVLSETRRLARRFARRVPSFGKTKVEA